jgi:hypothetical protein
VVYKPWKAKGGKAKKIFKTQFFEEFLSSTVDMIQRLRVSDGSSISEQYFLFLSTPVTSISREWETMSPKTPSGAVHGRI